MEKNNTKHLQWIVLFVLAPFYITSSTSLELITNPERSDGFGSQFMLIISSAITAELNNKKFVYTPFKQMEHNYDNDPHFIEKKEWLINFIGNFEIKNPTTDNPLIVYENPLVNYDNVTVANSLTLKKIRKIFRENKYTYNIFNNTHFNIVIHIRRYNPHDSMKIVDVSDSIYLNIMNRLRLLYADKQPLFHLHSQGVAENFKVFEAPDVILHLNKSVEDSFIAMVFADALIVARSCFSYSAAFLSEGIIYYQPQMPHLPQWISVDTLLQP